MAKNHDQESPLAVDARPGTPFWSENFALVFADPVSQVAGLYSIGTWYQDTRCGARILRSPCPMATC
jgi:hypothetical protein